MKYFKTKIILLISLSSILTFLGAFLLIMHLYPDLATGALVAGLLLPVIGFVLIIKNRKLN